MFTFFWIAVAVFWVVGLTVWNLKYPKTKRGQDNG
jgi:hypothetical protein